MVRAPKPRRRLVVFFKRFPPAKLQNTLQTPPQIVVTLPCPAFHRRLLVSSRIASLRTHASTQSPSSETRAAPDAARQRPARIKRRASGRATMHTWYEYGLR